VSCIGKRAKTGWIDNATASRLKTQFAAHLREQITLGIPTGRDEAGLRRLARQLRAGQVVVKLFLPYPLHAKLYLLFRDDVNNPITGFVGSSNLTMSGLSRHGELNVDVLDHLGTQKLGVVRRALGRPLGTGRVGRSGLDHRIQLGARRSHPAAPHLPQHRLPPQHRSAGGFEPVPPAGRFEQELFEFQKSAVKIAARHLHRRGGVMIGDVVGLGKTMMATALARMFEDDLGYETLDHLPQEPGADVGALPH
jgi:hypothetical protein